MKKEANNTKQIKLPKNVELKATKSSITFARGERKAVLKSHALEITNPIKELGKRMKAYTEETIKKCHLGSIKGVINGIEDSVDLQKIIDKYFKTSSTSNASKVKTVKVA